MIPAIVIGREGSKGMPRKNSYVIRDYPMMAYPIMAAKNCQEVDQVFFSTDSLELGSIAFKYGSAVIDRPEELATDEALGEDVFVHAYNEIVDKRGKAEMVVLMFANAPCIVSHMIYGMIILLRNNTSADSICTISKYNMWSPYRARTLRGVDVHNFLNEDHFKDIDCDRDSGGDVYFYDCSCAVVRPYCLENMAEGLPPQRWLGRNIMSWIQETPALDVDYIWQIGQVEYWLDKHWYNKI